MGRSRRVEAIGDDAGFTLIEVLVALVMSALLLAVIFDGVALTRTRTVNAARRREALLLGQELLARGAVAPFSAEPTRGAANGLAWQVSQQIEARDPRGLLALVRVHAAITTVDGKQVSDYALRRIKALPQQ